jgi:hypothetical protein
MFAPDISADMRVLIAEFELAGEEACRATDEPEFRARYQHSAALPPAIAIIPGS